MTKQLIKKEQKTKTVTFQKGLKSCLKQTNDSAKSGTHKQGAQLEQYDTKKNRLKKVKIVLDPIKTKKGTNLKKKTGITLGKAQGQKKTEKKHKKRLEKVTSKDISDDKKNIETVVEDDIDTVVEDDIDTVATSPDSNGTIENDQEPPSIEPVASDLYCLADRTICKEALANERWTNKQRVLILSSRGISHRSRHLMEDIKRLLPHCKEEPKWEKRASLQELNEVCEMQSCNSCLFFEVRKTTELYLWVTRAPNGPSIKFQVLNSHTLGELRMTGNCLLHSRPLIIFDKAFDDSPELRLTKELLMQVFGTPRNHPKSKPFYDHVMSFFVYDKKIWFRHYQISPMTDADADKPERQLLTEIGPRFVLDPIKILDGSFGGRTLYVNPYYLTPTAIRIMANRGLGSKYAARIAAKHDRYLRLLELKRIKDPLAPENIFKSSRDNL